MSCQWTLEEHGWVLSRHQHSLDGVSVGFSTAWMSYQVALYSRTWIGNQQPQALDGCVIRTHTQKMDGFKVGTSTASMGYQWVNYPAWMGFQWNAPGESLECLGACSNDTPWTVPESLSCMVHIVAALSSHQYTSDTAMDSTADTF